MKDEDVTTIQLKKSVVKELKNIKKYPRETYNETISGLNKNCQRIEKNTAVRRVYPQDSAVENERVMG